jgi:hypothetical protein
MQTLSRVVEGNIRAYIATKKQSEVLSLREIVEVVHTTLIPCWKNGISSD